MKNIEELKQELLKGREFKYLFFWGHTQKDNNIIDKSCLSQWFHSRFEIDNICYPTAEHYMMAEKARLFDLSMLEQILEAKTTKEVKSLGRKVKNFDEKIWNEKSFDIVFKGNLAKFSQNSNLKDFLLSTSKWIIVEASPYDKVWGIGMLENHEHASSPLRWRGLNKLGFVLTEIREAFQ